VFFVKQLGIRFLDEGLHRVLFNAMPMPVFVVDEDVRILEYNAAAARLLGSDKRAVLQRRGGAVLHCLHATESLEGCGQAPACSHCQVLESVRAAAHGRPVLRQSAQMELVNNGGTRKVDVRIGCHPFTYNQQKLILLMVEGLGD
jgi:PAS domain-containing protein